MAARDIPLAYHLTYTVDENNNVVKQYELVNDVETNVIEFVYDSNNTPIYFTYNNATYYYEKNLQGDIVAILDANDNTVVQYTYDIWGKLENITGSLADALGITNPLRYRGYYFDTETGLYYLQSRYYSPNLMRFISQDDPGFSNAQGEPLGSNLYAYCLNNPVMNIDLAGFASSIWSLKNDKFGIQILKWYLYGGGKKRTITSSSWAAYMKANKILKVKVRSILKPLSKKIKTNKTIRIIIKTSMEIENGEDIIGYQYLHGTNAKAGGFVIEAFITKNRRGQTTFCCSYMWNDIIDPNYSYESDSKKAKLAKFVSFGYAKDYYICIIWSDTSVLDSNGKWIRGWLK